MIEHRIGLGEFVSLAFACNDVQKLRAFERAYVAQRRYQRIQIVAIYGTDVVEAELLEQGAGRDHAFDVLLGSLCEFTEHLCAGALGDRVEAPRHQFRQILVEGTDRRRDRHVVVIEHNK